ncbi:MAG: 50S ribosomal protein L25 [Phycisphaerae bacterium]
MQISTLEAEPRQANGTRAARRLRRDGKLPAVIYGHGESPENVAIPVRELTNLVNQGQHVVELRVDGQPKQVLIKEVQFDHMSSTPVHVDFMRVDLHERVTVSVPLEFKGTPTGTNEGGMFEPDMVDVEVECTVTEIPELIRVNVADMKLGDVLHVRDLQLPPNVTAVTAPESIVCSVRAKIAATEAAPAVEGEEAAQPEIIGRREREEEEGEE